MPPASIAPDDATLPASAASGPANPPTHASRSRAEIGAAPTRVSADPAAPMIIVRLVPQGGTCANEGTQIPALTIYRDGSVLMSDDRGSYCEPLPLITAGQIDPTWAADHLNRYFESAAGGPDMTTLDGNVGVADGSTTDLTFTSNDGIDHHAAAYVLDMTGLGLSPEKTQARKTFRATLDGLRNRITAGDPWTPESLRLTNPPEWVPNYNGQSNWPTDVSHEVESVIAGGAGSCTMLTGSEAAAVRDSLGSTPAMSTWLIDGKPQRLAIGVSIPGLQEDCAIK